MKKPPVILIVDDDITNIEIMRAILHREYKICFAKSGAQAIATVKVAKPDLILLDVVMPGMDGYEVCRLIKQEPNFENVPVIFTTGMDGPDSEVRGLAAGAIDYVTKPIQPASLRRRVSNHIALKRTRDHLADMALTDPLTGLANRRHLESQAENILQRLQRQSDWLTVVMLDIDYFKCFNDLYGHPAGDRCIRTVAGAISRNAKRAGELCARYGGEEFCCVLPGTDPIGAGIVAEQMRSAVEGMLIPHAGSQASPHVTVSIGAASGPCHNDADINQWLSAADRMLYDSKAAGRNRVSCVDLNANHLTTAAIT